MLPFGSLGSGVMNICIFMYLFYLYIFIIYATIWKFGVSKIFLCVYFILIFVEEINTFIQQGCIKCIKSIN